MASQPADGGLLTISIPPGVFRNGTAYQAEGRYFDCNLMRFFEGSLRPMGGWTAFSASTVTGAARRMISWADTSGGIWTAVGTHSHLYVFDVGGAMNDITPAGFVVGRADANNLSGYGGGAYGGGLYGAPGAIANVLNPATVWALDTLEQYLVGCTADDGAIYKWDLVTAHVAAVCAGAPVNNRSLVVTEEGFLVALGAGGDPRMVTWADQGSFTAWTPGALNQAGFYALQTTGKIMCGLRLSGATIIFCNTDVHLMVYAGLPAIYTFQLMAEDCGIISQGAFASVPNMVMWMGVGGFWSYNGSIAAVPSEVGDYVFGRLNVQQASKIFAVHNASFGEVAWYYPSTNGTEIDSYVLFNYREKTWNIGALTRTCGTEAGVIANPLMVDAAGAVWVHENGYMNYSGAGDRYAETGPIELGQTYRGLEIGGGHVGETTFDVVAMAPDALTLGDGQVTFYSKFYPLDVDRVWGPYSLSDPTDLRISGRQLRMRITGKASGDFRFGQPRLDFRAAGRR